MFKDILPECEVRQECANVTLELNCVKIFGVIIRLSLHIVGEGQNERKTVLWMQDGKLSAPG